jgi:uncharacterized membrane protein YcjF (UPF0283 family)
MASKKKPELSERFYDLMERLFKEIDQEQITRDVNALKAKHRGASNRELAKILTRRVGAAVAIPTGPFALLAMAPDIFNLVRAQSRLVLSIAFVYGMKPNLKERFREVLATLAVATGASAARRGVAWYVVHRYEKQAANYFVRKIAAKFSARAVPRMVPIVSSLVGGAINYGSVAAVGKAATEYYEKRGAA